MSIPNHICLSLPRPTKDLPYCAKAVKDLWGGKKVSPILPFGRADFSAFRREASGRISISGVQEKISLSLVDRALTPTTKDGRYILKPVPRALGEGLDLIDDVPANEHVTMQIASQVFGLRVASNGLVFFPNEEPAYIVRRFDYEPKSGRKLSQEDFCQLAGRNRQSHGENFKYSGSYEELGRVLERYCPAYRIEVEKLFSQIVFNYVFGNGDAHLKNFSLLESSLGDHFLSPCYDLLNTSVHLPNETRMALDLFDEYESESYQRNGFYKRVDFLELATRYGIQPKRAAATLAQYPARQKEAGELIKASLLSAEAKERYLKLVNDRVIAISD